jgi:hypothetical protein
MLGAPVSVSKKRAAHLHRAESIYFNTPFSHPKVLNSSHATHFGHGDAARQGNGNAALPKKCRAKNFFCNQCSAQ